MNATSWKIEKIMTLGGPFQDGSLRQLQQLPRTAAGLRAYFLKSGHSPFYSLAERLFWNAFTLFEEPVPPQVRAAAYCVIAAIPGVRAAGWVTDPLGRRGFAVAWPAGATTARFIFDPSTSEFLARETIAGPKGARPGESGPSARPLPPGTMSWLAIRQVAWTDKAPRHAVVMPG